MGGDRGGWYSWDRLDNGGRPSAHEVHPEWQDLAVGDFVKYWRGEGAVDAWRVAVLEPNRFLGLHGLTDLRLRNLDPEQPRPRGYTEGLWGFLLTGLPGGRTRLVIGGYEAFRPRWLGRVFSYAPVVWIMQARTMAVLKRNVESAARTRRQSASLLRLASCARVSASLGQVPYSRAAVSISRLSCSFSGS
jgi:proline iminopeptidase